jgi:MFS family permease
MQKSLFAIRLIFLSFGLAISSLAPLIPLIKSQLDLNDAELGMLLLISGIGTMLSMPATGWIMNKIGSPAVILFSGLGMVICLPALSIAPSIPILSITLFCFGVVGSALNVSMNAQAVAIEIEAKLPILSGIHCWFSIGGLLGPIVISSLLLLEIPIFYCILGNSALVLLILLTQRNHLLNAGRQFKKSPKSFFWHRQAVILGCLCFIAFMAEGALLDWSAEYLRSNLEYDVAIAGIGYSIFSIAMAAGRSFGNRAIKKLGSQLIFQLGCLIAALGFAIVITASWTSCELFGFALIGLGASNIVPIVFSSSGKLSNISSNTALTIVTTCGYIGLLVGPVFVGILAEATSLSLSFLGLAILLAGLGIFGRPAIHSAT